MVDPRREVVRPPASLTGEGVVLRAFSPADAGSIAPICGDAEVCNWSSLPWTPDTGALLAWIEGQRQVHAAGEGVSMAITLAGLDAAVGWIGLSPLGEREASLGYWIVPAARRRGLTLAAARALVDWAFVTGYAERIAISTGPHNAGSRRIAERLGARRRPGVAVEEDATGTPRDQVRYVLSRVPFAGLGRTIPALPVRSVDAAVAFYRERLGFAAVHEEAGFAVLRRDDATVHLWEAADAGWSSRAGFAEQPVRSGAESFLAGTASCRIETEDVDALYAELTAAGVLHPVARDGVRTTEFGTRELAALDLDGNLLEFFRWV
jgi:RimJ/RimL family protein N-acetyltransferase/catechol 2,3-dioxygenase-like lactoylglutathione lyase family enzyme